MARRRLNRRGVRTVIISRRGRGASTNEGAGGDGVYYVASVFGGKCDLQMSLEGGVIQPLQPLPGRILDAMEYAVGALPALSGGFGWEGDGVVSVPFAQLASQDAFDAYNLGGVAEGGLAEGSGWNGSAVLFAW